MKKVLFFLSAVVMLGCCNLYSQQSQKSKSISTNEGGSDRIALRELIDTFSILADKKDITTQMNLFTDNATVESIINGNSTGVVSGKKQIGDAFKGFLDRFDVVYHMNGQQVLKIDKNNASGTYYCTVTLISTNNGKKMKTTFLVIYDDTYVKQAGKWLISSRKSNFVWTETVEVAQ